ncbi:M24 family metallopeptidase [Chitinophaga sp.]|uniref:M24 family metallopeptidase n=1 Tax=Chitinophaga sp. TaxID=1869181 RepID=UPI002F9427B2
MVLLTRKAGPEPTLYGYRELAQMIRPGISETDVRLAFEMQAFRHGGHTVPYDTVAGSGSNNLSPRIYFGSRLRVDLQLEPGHLITVEPGLYFIKALLEDPEFIKKHREDVNWNEVEHWKNIGGVRIEDNILVTASGNENLTEAVPKATHI